MEVTSSLDVEDTSDSESDFEGEDSLLVLSLLLPLDLRLFLFLKSDFLRGLCLDLPPLLSSKVAERVDVEVCFMSTSMFFEDNGSHTSNKG